MAKLDKSAVQFAMSNLVTTLGLAPVRKTATTSADSTARKAARIAEYQKILREGGFTRASGNRKGKFRTIGAPIALEYALKLVRLGGELPAEFLKKTPWANAVDALEALADAVNVDRKVMLTAFGVKPAMESGAPAAQVVAEVAGMQVIKHAPEAAPAAEPVNVVPMTRNKRGNKKSA
jgi:hypothetical protein